MARATRIAARGGPVNRGAETLTWELAVELEGAVATGEAISGEALGWRKTFNPAPPAAANPPPKMPL
eukprot:984889-Lingulodinium_polyedra.AAC.1